MSLAPEQWRVFAILVVGGVMAIAFLMVASRRAAEVTARLARLARERGWQNIEPLQFLGAGVRGQWNGFQTTVRRVPRRKYVPEQLVTRIRLQVPARLSIVRRVRGFRGGRPLTLFGPPLAELRSGAGSSFWIRTDEITMAERLFANPDFNALMERSLVTRFDSVSMSGDTLRIMRANGNRHFGGAAPEQVVAVAGEELDLARLVIESLTLRP